MSPTPISTKRILYCITSTSYEVVRLIIKTNANNNKMDEYDEEEEVQEADK
jgi:hypothetical protein